MSASNSNELAAVAGTELAVLAPAARAAIVMGADKLRAELTELAASTKDIVAVIDKAGRDQVHSAAMVLRKRKTGITGSGKAARDNATKFSKAVIVVEKDLVDLIEPEEDRLLALRDGFDAIEAERKAAELAADIARIKKIEELIDQISSAPVRHIDSDSAKISRAIEFYEALPIDEGAYAEFTAKAEAIRTAVLAKLEDMHQKELAAERAAAAAEAARIAEVERMAAERTELARLRAEADERDRLATIEAARVAAEQATEAKRLRDLAAAQAAELQALRGAEAARASAAQAEQARVAAETKRQLDEQQAAIAAERRALDEQKAAAARAEQDRVTAEALREKIAADHDEALAMNAKCDTDREVRRAELQAQADQHLADARDRADDKQAAGLPVGALGVEAIADALPNELFPEDSEIVDAIRIMFWQEFGMDDVQADARMQRFDYAGALAAMGAA